MSGVDTTELRKLAEAALSGGELAAEMGWRVTWPEVNRLDGIIRDLLADNARLTSRAEAAEGKIARALEVGGVTVNSAVTAKRFHKVRRILTEGDPE